MLVYGNARCGVDKNCCCPDACSGDGTLIPLMPRLSRELPIAPTRLSHRDLLGAWKVRLGIGRMKYTVEPGLYAVGSPGNDSPVLVSANYKLTFDRLREKLAGLDCRLLLLDTKGVNVWCAAGKGTFGTDELVRQIERTGLSELVTHRKLIVPQLGAPGVSAHEVARRTGFSVTYGPVHASDIKEFIASGCKATREMRTVRFTLRDRLVLTPVNLIAAAKTMLFLFGMLFLLNLAAARPFGLYDVIAYAGAVLTGTVITPALLPLLPGRAFAWKGGMTGLLWAVIMLWFFQGYGMMTMLGYVLLLPAVSAWYALDFTGSSTYASPSGVLKEMRIALPIIIVLAGLGALLILTQSLFIGKPL